MLLPWRQSQEWRYPHWRIHEPRSAELCCLAPQTGPNDECSWCPWLSSRLITPDPNCQPSSLYHLQATHRYQAQEQHTGILAWRSRPCPGPSLACNVGKGSSGAARKLRQTNAPNISGWNLGLRGLRVLHTWGFSLFGVLMIRESYYFGDSLTFVKPHIFSPEFHD